ncbi:hypothetical protein VTL71DRAFT_10645 [Oculimacula yallundae]|uniref:Uncharacterized protein n=1 Tax=Oculimacula yallundae TaxID=86028 RepID=A0ABR4CVX2_9HELO
MAPSILLGRHIKVGPWYSGFSPPLHGASEVIQKSQLVKSYATFGILILTANANPFSVSSLRVIILASSSH